MTGEKTLVVVWGTMDLVVSQMTGGITAPATCGMMRGIAGRVNRPMTGVVTGLVAVSIVGEAAREAHRETAVGVALRTMYGIAL